MDIFKQAAKKLKSNHSENEQNTRRIAENYPMIEAKNDQLIFDKGFKMEFSLSDHPHSVKLNITFKPPVNCFKCNQGAAVNEVAATVTTPTTLIQDGNQHEVGFTAFTHNVGGFELDSFGSLIVPISGVYNFNYSNGIAGVTTSSAAAVIASIRIREAIVVQKAWTVANQGWTVPASIGVGVNIWALCMPLEAGTAVSAWQGAGGIAFYLNSGTSFSATLVALL
jgi:hypothetical protein